MESETTTPSPGSDPPDYSDVISFEESPLYQAVVNLDTPLIRHLLDLQYNILETGQYTQTVLHAMLYYLSSRQPNDECWKKSERIRMVYMLTNSGVNVNARDSRERTALQYAVDCKDVELCDVLLQCGADMFVTEENGITLYDAIASSVDSNCNPLTDLIPVFEKYQPGLWDAVASENLSEVRKLINLWCKTDLEKNGKPLLELAKDTHNEGIISLLSAVIPSMRLVYHVLAGDVMGVHQIFNSELKNKLHVNLKNIGQRAAPILYFVIQEKNFEMLQEFVKHGCSIVAHMNDENGFEMPVIFSALKSDIPANMITELLPNPVNEKINLLEHLMYKGNTVLQTALEHEVVDEAINSILEQGGARLVCIRNMYNQTPRDWALQRNKMNYVHLIDNHVVQWVLNADKYVNRREILALWGYEHIADVTYNWIAENRINVEDIETDVLQYLEGLDMYQEQISELAEAIELDDIVAFKDRIIYKGNGPFEQNLFWDGRSKGDGLPLLHRAVICNNFPIVSLILWHWEKSGNLQSVDSLLDQNRRTALHYTCGMENTSEIRCLLHQYGFSEHTLDKDGHEPLDFTEVQGTPVMKSLINRIKFKKYETFEPDPWDQNILAEVRHQRAQRLSSMLPFGSHCGNCKCNRGFQPSYRSNTLPVFKLLGSQPSIPHCQSQIFANAKQTPSLSPRRKLNLNLTRLMQTPASNKPSPISQVDEKPADEDSDMENSAQQQEEFRERTLSDQNVATSDSDENCEERKSLLPRLHNRQSERSCTFL